MRSASFVVKARRGDLRFAAQRVNRFWPALVALAWATLALAKTQESSALRAGLSVTFAVLFPAIMAIAGEQGPPHTRCNLAPPLLLAANPVFVEAFCSNAWSAGALCGVACHAVAAARLSMGGRLALFAVNLCTQALPATTVPPLPFALIWLPCLADGRLRWTVWALPLGVAARFAHAPVLSTGLCWRAALVAVCGGLGITWALRAAHGRPARRFVWPTSLFDDATRLWTLALGAIALEMAWAGPRVDLIVVGSLYFSVWLGGFASDATRALCR